MPQAADTVHRDMARADNPDTELVDTDRPVDKEPASDTEVAPDMEPVDTALEPAAGRLPGTVPAAGVVPVVEHLRAEAELLLPVAVQKGVARLAVLP